MLEYILAGLALGSIYAIASASITVTYVSTGILNFAFGAFAYFLARVYYWLHTNHEWGIVPAALMTLVVIAPAMGAILYVVLLRHLRMRSTLVQIVATIGLFVALPPFAAVLFGNETINAAPGLAPTPVHVYRPFGTAISMDQVIVFVFLIGIVGLGTLFLRFTDIGLRVRGLVSTRALTSLSGINPSAISIGVWMISTSLAGLTGILAAPSSGLTPDGMTALMAAAFAAVIAAKLRSLPTAVVVALLMGVFTDVVQKYLPSNGSFAAAVVPSVPFVVTALALMYFYLRHGSIQDSVAGGGALDAAIAPQGGGATASLARKTQHAVQAKSAGLFSFRSTGSLVALGLIALLPVMFSGYWLTLIIGGFAYGLIFLSFTLAMGEGGFLWLSLISFAGLGALVTAQLATVHGWPALLALLVSALIITPVGILLGILTIRFGGLYVALSTLTFGLLVETLVFTRDRFLQQGIGVPLSRPDWASDDRTFGYLVLAVFLIVALFLVNMRRSTTGLALGAARHSEAASTSVLGLSVVGLKVFISALATFVAALGGGLLAMYAGTALPANFPTFTGLVWLAVLVTIGVRSIVAASIAGLAFTVVPGLFQTYLSGAWGNVPAILFGLGAIALVIDPDGTVTSTARRVEELVARLRSGHESEGERMDIGKNDDEGTDDRAGVTEIAQVVQAGRP